MTLHFQSWRTLFVVKLNDVVLFFSTKSWGKLQTTGIGPILNFNLETEMIPYAMRWHVLLGIYNHCSFVIYANGMEETWKIFSLAF